MGKKMFAVCFHNYQEKDIAYQVCFASVKTTMRMAGFLFNLKHKKLYNSYSFNILSILIFKCRQHDHEKLLPAIFL